MRCFFPIALVVAGSLAGGPAANGQSKPADESKKPVAASQSSANPFPEDTSTVPVMPSNATQALPEGSYNGLESAPVTLPGDDLDPVRSPDDPEPAAASGKPDDFSSSLAGVANLLPPTEDDRSGKRKLAVKEPTHQEAASKDIEVGSYYLETKDWKGALSRFESALVLDPENPDVYWGLAEADRHLGNLAYARANYEKVVEYDPDSHHGKEARKKLKEPEIANGKNVAASQPPAVQTEQ